MSCHEMGDIRREAKIQKKGREWRLPDFLYADDLVLRGDSDDLRAMVGMFC